MIFAPYRRTLALLAAFALVLAASAAPKWNTLQAPHCLIVSQLSEKETRAWASEFEQFTAALRRIIAVDERFLPPLTVVLFADSRSFGPYVPRGSDGKKRDVAGYFASRETWGVIGLANGFDNEDTRHVVLHEATHWLLSATPTEIPLWLNEGFAEVFSTFEARKGHILLGQPIPYHVEALARNTWVPLLQLLLTNAGDRLYTDSNRNPVFYAESWLFVHQLLFQDRSATDRALNTFFKARRSGSDQLAAFEAAFGKDTAAADADLQGYFRHGGFTLSKLPVSNDAPIGAPFAPAQPIIVEVALARLALGAQQRELARTHIDKATALVPTAPAPYELRASLEYEGKNNAEAATAAAAALERGSQDAKMHLLVAQSLWQHHADRNTLGSAAREIAGHYAKAIELQPKLRFAYESYARLAQSIPTVTQADASILADGYKIFPDATSLLVGIAVVLHKGHNDAEALRLLANALSHQERLTQEERAYAENLRTAWKIEPLAHRIEELEKKKLYPEALAACEQLIQEPLQINQRRFWEGRLNELRFRVGMDAAVQAENSGRIEEALQQAEALATNPELTQYQRTVLNRYLERLRQRSPKSSDSPAP